MLYFPPSKRSPKLAASLRFSKTSKKGLPLDQILAGASEISWMEGAARDTWGEERNWKNWFQADPWLLSGSPRIFAVGSRSHDDDDETVLPIIGIIAVDFF